MNEAFFHTINLKAAVAIATLGFEPNKPAVTRIKREDGKESVVFWFKDRHPKTGKSASEVYRWMTKEAELINSKEPENPINYIRSALLNRDVYVEMIRNFEPYVELVSSGRRIAIRGDISEEDKRRFAKRL